MADFHILTLDEFEPKKMMKFNEPKPNKFGGRIIPMTYGELSNFYLRFPRCRCPFGVGKDMSGSNYRVQLSLQNPEHVRKFQELDQLVEQQALEHPEEWGIPKPPRGEYNRDYILSKHNPLLKYPMKRDGLNKVIDDRYPPYVTLNLMVDQKTRAFTTEVYDQKGVIVHPFTMDRESMADEKSYQSLSSAVPNQSEVSAIVRMTSAYVMASGYGIVPKVNQMRVYPQKMIPKGQCLIDDGEEDLADERFANQSDLLDDREDLVDQVNQDNPDNQDNLGEPPVEAPTTSVNKPMFRPKVK